MPAIPAVDGQRPTTAVDDDLVWRAVSAESPCPVCGAFDGCGVADAEGFVLCRAVPSEHPLDVGGWLHAIPSAGRARR